MLEVCAATPPLSTRDWPKHQTAFRHEPYWLVRREQMARSGHGMAKGRLAEFCTRLTAPYTARTGIRRERELYRSSGGTRQLGG